MTNASIGTPEQLLRDPNYTPALHRAIPLGIQHVLAMFVSNVTPAIIIAGAAGFMRRHVMTIGAISLIICGLIPKVGAVIRTIPIEVLGGGVIVMFGMVVAADISTLSDVNWNRRNMAIFAIALSVGLGLQLDPKAVQYLPDTLHILMTSGLLPAALIAIVLNLIPPEELSDEATEEVSGGMAGHAKGELVKADNV